MGPSPTAGGTTSTGRVAMRSTRSAMEPNRNLLTPLAPRVASPSPEETGWEPRTEPPHDAGRTMGGRKRSHARGVGGTPNATIGGTTHVSGAGPPGRRACP